MTDHYEHIHKALEGLRERCAQEAERITARRRTVAALSNNEAVKPCEVAAAIRKIDVQQYYECAAMVREVVAQPKRRLYNASGSLSEYGVFPECDAQQSTTSSETVNVVGMPEFDGLLDHIYEYGAEAEGVIEKANAFARAVIARYSPQQPTEIERDRLATTLQAEVEALRAEVDGTIRELRAERDQLAAALDQALMDAERYQWLRDREIPEWLDLWHQNPDRIDAAIDEAMWNQRARPTPAAQESGDA